MRILLTGANGQVGWELSNRSGKHGIEILALDRSDLDITDPVSVSKEVNHAGASLVVNAAGYTAVDQAESEPELAFAVNRDGPAYLASACSKAGIPLVNISTDYVFDGRKEGAYLVTDPVSPLSVYGKSKAAGEAELRKYLKEHFILRTGWVYGVHGDNFVKTMLRLGREREVVQVVSDQYGCPTYAADLAETILKIAARSLEGGQVQWGTYHYCGKGVTTWHGFAEEIFRLASEYASLKVKRVEPISTSEYPTPAKRPASSILDCAVLESTFNIHPQPWAESLAHMLDVLFSAEASNNPSKVMT
ncbi:MAG: dTDP-4-dehydrorhamnose reductase [Syntrophobacterales bacterium]|jgi:dTDP-4-dehydrorhamnose reductase